MKSIIHKIITTILFIGLIASIAWYIQDQCKAAQEFNKEMQKLEQRLTP